MKNLLRICLLFIIMGILLSMASPAIAADSAIQSTSGSVGLDAQKPLGGSEKLLETAKALGVSQMQVSRMERRILARLRDMTERWQTLH